MNLNVTLEGNISIIVVDCAQLDVSNSKNFKDAMAPYVGKAANILLDLEKIEFCDSSGLGAILSSYRVLRDHGGEMRLCSMQSSVRTLFSLVRANRIFEIFNNREEALKILSA